MESRREVGCVCICSGRSFRRRRAEAVMRGRSEPSVVEIECVAESSKVDVWSEDTMQVGDIVEEIHLGERKKGEMPVWIRVRRGSPSEDDEFCVASSCRRAPIGTSTSSRPSKTLTTLSPPSIGSNAIASRCKINQMEKAAACYFVIHLLLIVSVLGDSLEHAGDSLEHSTLKIQPPVFMDKPQQVIVPSMNPLIRVRLPLIILLIILSVLLGCIIFLCICCAKRRNTSAIIYEPRTLEEGAGGKAEVENTDDSTAASDVHTSM